MTLSRDARDNLRELEGSLEEFNGYPIKNLGTAKRLDSFIASSDKTADKEAPAALLKMLDTASRRTMAGDTSTIATCALEIGQESRFFTQNLLSKEERKLSSGQRELLTVLRPLQQEGGFFETLKNVTIVWLTDSTNLVSFLSKGTMKMAIQRKVLEVYKLLAKYRIRIVPVHLRRTDYRIQWADEGSRSFDPDDWGIDQASFRQITKTWKPTVDLFAHATNAKCERFYSYGDAPRTAGVDAMARSWNNELAWACPPVYLVAEVVRKIAHTNMMAILVVPAWRTAPFWSALFPDGQKAVRECISIKLFRPHVVIGKFCMNKLMQGRTAFPFLALFLRSTGRGYVHASGDTECPDF